TKLARGDEVVYATMEEARRQTETTLSLTLLYPSARARHDLIEDDRARRRLSADHLFDREGSLLREENDTRIGRPLGIRLQEHAREDIGGLRDRLLEVPRLVFTETRGVG